MIEIALRRALGGVRRLAGRFRPPSLPAPSSGQVEKAAARVKDLPTEVLAEIVARRAAGTEGNPLHDVFYRYGFHLLRKHFYLPIPDDTDELGAFWTSSSALLGVDTNAAAALDLMRNVLPPYLDEFRARFPIERPTVPSGFYLINGGYMAVDAHVLYGLIRAKKPRRIIEIGCGNSTLLTIATNETNREEGAPAARITSIDPYPWDIFRHGCPGLELIEKKVQVVPMSVFEELGENDVLFIDSSHVIRSGNDVHYEFLEVLPRLRPGVLVHVHDISLPKPYPKVYYDNQLYWNEQYLLQAFLIYNHRFRVLWPGNYMMETHRDEMLATFPEIEIMRRHYPMSEPTAFWMRS